VHVSGKYRVVLFTHESRGFDTSATNRTLFGDTSISVYRVGCAAPGAMKNSITSWLKMRELHLV